MNLRRTLSLLPVYLLYGMTFALAGLGKFADGGVPSWFSDQFGKTFLVSFPGLPLAFYSIATLEVFVAALLVISLAKGELFKNGRPLVLELALFVAGMVFCQLGFGLRLVADFAGAFSLFMYTVGTGIAYLYVEKVVNEHK